MQTKMLKPSLFTAHNLSKLTITLMGLGTVLFFFFFLFKPVFTIIKRAFIANSGFTLAYIKLLFNNQQFFFYLVNSFRIGLITTFFTILIALPLALINNKFTYSGKQAIFALITVSMFAPPFVSSIGLKYFFSNYGTVNSLLMHLGLIREPIYFLSGNSILPIVFIQVLHLYPIMYLSLSSTLSNIDPSIEEASITLGMSRWRRYRDIVWPLARPGFFSGAILVFIWSFTDLSTPLMTSFHAVLSVGIFHQMNEMIDNPYGYVMVFSMMCITTLFVILLKWVIAIDHRHKMIGKTYSTRSLARPNRWEALGIYTFLTSLILVSFIPHIGVFFTSIAERWCNSYLPTTYTLQAYKNLFSSSCLSGIKNSLFYGFIATFTNLVIGSFIAYTIAKKRVFWVGLVDALVMMPLFLPGIIMGFGYIITYMNTWLDTGKNPAFLLIMAYTMRYIPYTVRVCTAGLQQLNDSLEEASTVFGASGFRTFWQITVPAILPSLLTSGVLAFSRTILEVSESLLLATKEAYYPITKMIYALYCSQGDGPTKASALGMVTLFIILLIVVISNKFLGKKANNLFKITS
ncbi:MAG: iron ABC transporter permease [Bacteroidota bacterium]